jgi:hypothetical protein
MIVERRSLRKEIHGTGEGGGDLPSLYLADGGPLPGKSQLVLAIPVLGA